MTGHRHNSRKLLRQNSEKITPDTANGPREGSRQCLIVKTARQDRTQHGAKQNSADGAPAPPCGEQDLTYYVLNDSLYVRVRHSSSNSNSYLLVEDDLKRLLTSSDLLGSLNHTREFVAEAEAVYLETQRT
jgi:hypothetical protein